MKINVLLIFRLRIIKCEVWCFSCAFATLSIIFLVTINIGKQKEEKISNLLCFGNYLLSKFDLESFSQASLLIRKCLLSGLERGDRALVFDPSSDFSLFVEPRLPLDNISDNRLSLNMKQKTHLSWSALLIGQ